MFSQCLSFSSITCPSRRIIPFDSLGFRKITVSGRLDESLLRSAHEWYGAAGLVPQLVYKA